VSALRRALGNRAGQAAAVGATLWLLSEAPSQAVSTAGALLLLTLTSDEADHVVGAYAGHVVLGTPVVAGAGWLVWVGTAVPVGVIGLLVGSWLVFDGVQHLRYGVGRETPLRGTTDANPIANLVRSAHDRVLRPFRLPRE
jgi:CBS-domain-containing membrane protein